MKTSLFQNKISIKKSPVHGFGVFADVGIAAGDLIEECYAILTSQKDRALRDFYFAAGERDCIPAGFAMIYNHSNEPNASYVFDPQYSLVIFRAIKPIKKGDEIFTYYGTEWFSCRALRVKKTPWWYRAKVTLLKYKAIMRWIVFLSVCFGMAIILQKYG